MEISKEIGAATGLRPRRPASLYGGSLKVPCLREKCLSVLAIAERRNGMKCRRDAGLLPHDQPMARCWKVCRILVANSADCAGFADSSGS